MTPDSTGLEGFLAHLAGAFELSNVRYAVVGSLASSFHGEPRGTRDIDIVVQLHRLDVGRLAAHFPEEHFYFDRDVALESLRSGLQFNVIDMRSLWKADIILPRDRFTQEELDRRQRVEIAGVPVFVASAEDTLVAKLRWAKASDSGRQIEDAAGILRVRGAELDLVRVRTWVAEFEVEEQWARALAASAR